MKGKNIDRRVVKTKHAIHNAFAQLLLEKELNDITITDIAELADINRKTFYNYYSGIHEVVDEIEDDIVDEFSEMLSETDFPDHLEVILSLFEKLTAIFNSDLDFYGNLFLTRGNSGLMEKITRLIKKRVQEIAIQKGKDQSPNVEIGIDFAVSGMLSVYRDWFNSNRDYSIEEISSVVGQMCSGGFCKLLGS